MSDFIYQASAAIFIMALIPILYDYFKRGKK